MGFYLAGKCGSATSSQPWLSTPLKLACVPPLTTEVEMMHALVHYHGRAVRAGPGIR
jgi:hypothetical protein